MAYNQIKRIRKAKGITQDVLAKALNISRSGYSERESGVQDFRMEELKIVAKILDVDTNTLIEDIKYVDLGKLLAMPTKKYVPRKTPIEEGEYFRLSSSYSSINFGLFDFYKNIQNLVREIEQNESITKEKLHKKLKEYLLKVAEAGGK